VKTAFILVYIRGTFLPDPPSIFAVGDGGVYMYAAFVRAAFVRAPRTVHNMSKGAGFVVSTTTST
jgi:hypothetical protein